MTRKKYEQKISENDEEFDELLQEFEAQPTFEEQLKSILDFCRWRLRANGFPDEVWVRRDGRKQRIYDYVIEQPGQDEDTDAGYAARILWHLHFALQPSAQEDIWHFAAHIDRAATLRTEVRLKFDKWGKFAEQQHKNLEDRRAVSAKNRAAKRDEIAADFKREAKAILQVSPGLKCHSVAVQIHKRRKKENMKCSEDKRLSNQSPRRITDKIKHLWE